MGRGHSEEWKDQKLEGKHVSDLLLRWKLFKIR